MDNQSEAFKSVTQDPADDRLQEFCHLYDEIGRRPDGELRLNQARAILGILAGGHIVDEDEEEAPARSDRTERIFTNFTNATMDLINCEDTPPGVREEITRMVDYFANELNGAPDFNGAYAHRVLAKVFELDD